MATVNTYVKSVCAAGAHHFDILICRQLIATKAVLTVNTYVKSVCAAGAHHFDILICRLSIATKAMLTVILMCFERASGVANFEQIIGLLSAHCEKMN